MPDAPRDIKGRPNHRQYILALRAMTPAQRVGQFFSLQDDGRSRFWQGLRQSRPDLSETELRRLGEKVLARCHNQNY
jgi:hypothetical protein